MIVSRGIAKDGSSEGKDYSCGIDSLTVKANSVLWVK